MEKIKVLIVEDEELARDLVKSYLSGIDDIEILDECENGFDALKKVQDLKPDLMFLDVQMPKINGFELLEVLDEQPAIIFTTAYDQYALKAFENNAIDYLLKPFSKGRFLQALDKARQQIGTRINTQKIENLKKEVASDDNEVERIVVKKGHKIVVIPTEKIHYLEANDDYVMIYSELGNFLKDKTMRFYERNLPNDFVRIHRSHIVPLSQIDTIEQFGKDSHLVVLKCGAKLRASVTGYRRLRERL
jgi:two-component system LytT family response regulator